MATDKPMLDRPWLMRTYSGHSSAAASNELYRANLEKGQTGLSIAFDLPTQTGYDSDHELARGEVGKVGVPICHIEDMEALFKDIPIEQMNTSMTINATAPWLLALYVAAAERQGASIERLKGTTQNDILKEYLSRGTHIFPPAASVGLSADVITHTVATMPKWNPINICSYHLQEAGATPTQEIAYALCAATTVLDAVRDRQAVDDQAFQNTVGRISFFVNAGIRFIEETCKMRAFVALWDRITRDRYGIEDAKLRRFRYGVQVNSLGLTERQPENNVQRIVLEMLAVTLSRDARARAVQLPAWNEAMGLPRPWDQQWALRMQQVLAFETDLLEYPDILDGSPVIEAKTNELIDGALIHIDAIETQGGMINAVDSGYVKRELVTSHFERIKDIESGTLKIVGVNCFEEATPSPLVADENDSILVVDAEAERDQIERLQRFRACRDDEQVNLALAELERTVNAGDNVMPASIACAHAGVTTGEWSDVLRQAFGEYRAPTGIDIVVNNREVPGNNADHGIQIDQLREYAQVTGEQLNRTIRMLVAKPGLDGHSNGAEQIAVKGRDIGFEVIYEGIRLTPAEIARAALEEGVHLIGLSILSGSHIELVAQVKRELAALSIADTPIVVGGIIPSTDAAKLKRIGVVGVYTPKDQDLNSIMLDMVNVVRRANGLSQLSAA